MEYGKSECVLMRRQNPPLIGSKEMEKQQQQLRSQRDRVRVIIKMEHNTDRWGDLEVEDDGPY